MCPRSGFLEMILWLRSASAFWGVQHWLRVLLVKSVCPIMVQRSQPLINAHDSHPLALLRKHYSQLEQVECLRLLAGVEVEGLLQGFFRLRILSQAFVDIAQASPTITLFRAQLRSLFARLSGVLRLLQFQVKLPQQEPNRCVARHELRYLLIGFERLLVVVRIQRIL